MKYIITEECIACAACEPECEEQAIGEEGEIFTVYFARCTDCGTCAEVCPVDACVPVDPG
jgi:NAD-dependent dihydropyrimidine dehydrogenase PreA subunit